MRGDSGSGTADERWAGIVAEVALMPEVVANLLVAHQPDERGLCTGPGCGSSWRGVQTRWPCSLHVLATAAKERRAGR
jgi:hypothetical protein